MATVTVLSGPERRRRWSSSEKASLVEESLQPGAMVTAVARRHDVHPNLLHHWRRQAKQGLDNGPGLKLLPVVVSPTAGSGSAAPLRSTGGCWQPCRAKRKTRRVHSPCLPPSGLLQRLSSRHQATAIGSPPERFLLLLLATPAPPGPSMARRPRAGRRARCSRLSPRSTRRCRFAGWRQ